MNNLSSSVNSSLEWRRSKVQELASQGYNQSEISKILQISQPTINRDTYDPSIDLDQSYLKAIEL